ncbi:MAG: FAD-binding protein [Gemmatimonadaceae bacterium]|nr:FAD-binding protein [Gemmatimonadaceae bacterium]
MTLRPNSLDELASLITESATHHRALRLVGRGTWLDGGAPVASGAEPLHLDAFGGIIEYEPGDLTITVGAATTIAELDAVTAANNQWCPLSPWGSDDGSVGATIATATPGPFAHAMGLPRDLILGLDCVDGTGKVLRPGGRVVKNVAGFDLVRLLTGSWGSLAAITRISLRLRARPAVDETWHVPLDVASAARAQDALHRSKTPPIACEVSEAGVLDAATSAGLLVRIAGNAAVVAAARAEVTALGDARRADSANWTQLRASKTRRAPRIPSSPEVRALNDSVRRAFDPAHILNPGIMG